MNVLRIYGVMVFMTVGLTMPAVAQEPTVVPMATSKFATLPGSPACLTSAVQRGDPKTGSSVMLSKFASGCLNPWHWHSTSESIVMVSGRGKLEMKGEPTRDLVVGDYFYMPGKHAHQFTCAAACMMSVTSDSARDTHYIDKDGKEIPAEQALKIAAKPVK